VPLWTSKSFELQMVSLEKCKCAFVDMCSSMSQILKSGRNPFQDDNVNVQTINFDTCHK
jgi:hypothetical protein